MIVRVCYCCLTVFMFIDDITANVGTSVRARLFILLFSIFVFTKMCGYHVDTHVRDSLELLFLYLPENIY